jgi:hypothetical protein
VYYNFYFVLFLIPTNIEMNTNFEVKIVLSSKTVRRGGGVFDVHMVNTLIINMYLLELYVKYFKEEQNYGCDPSLRELSIKSLLARYTL